MGLRRNVLLLAVIWFVTAFGSACGASGSSSPSTDAASGGDGPPSLAELMACAANDGRCVVCAWEEAGVDHCKVTIYGGSCRPGTWDRENRCAPTPRAVCDGSCFIHADRTFYYDGDDLAAAEAACKATPSSFGDECPPIWKVLR